MNTITFDEDALPHGTKPVHPNKLWKIDPITKDPRVVTVDVDIQNLK
jgi:hypothetical protein